MSYVRILVHSLWGTYKRQPLLVRDKRSLLFEHIRSNAQSKGIYIDTINGYVDHVHCLISLNPDQNMAKVMQLIKGESSFWANKQNMFLPRLDWADDYFAASVSETAVNRVRQYIKTQEQHHSKISFAQEYEHFIKSYGFMAEPDEP